ncbi:MAG: DNA topoisomerase I [Bdellovibrionales bacterium RBG_16_40_8]|nr:MAG: DNA topoisomerase I [Bdellovibrionales bacterium RBG_16_40_8]
MTKKPTKTKTKEKGNAKEKTKVKAESQAYGSTQAKTKIKVAAKAKEQLVKKDLVKKELAKKETSNSGRKLVIVESPTKAKTIRKFLGRDYTVESCMGHVRDLPQSAKDIPEKFKKKPWANLGVNVDDHFEPIYCVPKTKTKIVSMLKDKLDGASELILATDEDREGESISWHLVNVLKPKVPVKRMVFNEITKEAIEHALKDFRDINMNLVRAQEARRILDRLVGYTISPLLWKKIAYGLSAGRVQSVAVRLVSEREHERLRFKKSSYWDITADNEKDNTKFTTRISAYKNRRIAVGKDFDSHTGQLHKDKAGVVLHLDENQARKITKEIDNKDWVVTDVEEKPISRKPAPPFITSTLQQEANRKLGLGSRETMQVAQKLYEKGMITYMRTDSMFLSEQAINAARDGVLKLYGKKYLPQEFRDYSKKKVKGAQEAHEAIRPAGTEFISPDKAEELSPIELKLYDLIWKRTIACQMVNSEHKQVTARLQVGEAVFNASGMTVEFPGFLKAYVESDDSTSDNEQGEVKLPKLNKNDKVKLLDLKVNVHETKPPARFTEASLVQTLEREGVGRPSTYAAIIGTIQDRGYVRKIGNALVPTFTALVVSRLLSQYLPNYVETTFTSAMEAALDDIAQGDMDQEKYLTTIYFGDKGLKKQVENREKEIDADASRSIHLEGLKNLTFRVGRYGAYVCRPESKDKEVCASIPENQFPGDITVETANKLIDQKINGADSIGKDPKTGLPVYVLSGRYGPYVQLGEGDKAEYKPKRMALPQGLEPEKVTLDQALWLITLPRKLGMHPQLKKEIKLGLGRFGPYVVCDGDYRSVPRTEVLFNVNLKRALELFSQPKRGRGRSVPLKELGPHPDLKAAVQVLSGKYGPYIKCGELNISLPQEMKPEDVTLKVAVELIAKKAKPERSRVKRT